MDKPLRYIPGLYTDRGRAESAAIHRAAAMGIEINIVRRGKHFAILRRTDCTDSDQILASVKPIPQSTTAEGAGP